MMKEIIYKEHQKAEYSDSRRRIEIFYSACYWEAWEGVLCPVLGTKKMKMQINFGV